jgi:hypothetical protein
MERVKFRMQKLDVEEYEEDEEVEDILGVLKNLQEEDDDIESKHGEPGGYSLLSSLDRSSDEYQESSEYITPYDNYGLERSLAIYLREIGRQSLLTKEDEVFLFAQIEKGQQIIHEAISETNIEFDMSEDDIDKVAARIEAMARDISLLKAMIADLDLGKELTPSQAIDSREYPMEHPTLYFQIRILEPGNFCPMRLRTLRRSC